MSTTKVGNINSTEEAPHHGDETNIVAVTRPQDDDTKQVQITVQKYGIVQPSSDSYTFVFMIFIDAMAVQTRLKTCICYVLCMRNTMQIRNISADTIQLLFVACGLLSALVPIIRLDVFTSCKT